MVCSVALYIPIPICSKLSSVSGKELTVSLASFPSFFPEFMQVIKAGDKVGGEATVNPIHIFLNELHKG